MIFGSNHQHRGLVLRTSENCSRRFARIFGWDQISPLCLSLQSWTGKMQENVSFCWARQLPAFPGGLPPSNVWKKPSAACVLASQLCSWSSEARGSSLLNTNLCRPSILQSTCTHKIWAWKFCTASQSITSMPSLQLSSCSKVMPENTSCDIRNHQMDWQCHWVNFSGWKQYQFLEKAVSNVVWCKDDENLLLESCWAIWYLESSVGLYKHSFGQWLHLNRLNRHSLQDFLPRRTAMKRDCKKHKDIILDAKLPWLLWVHRCRWVVPCLLSGFAMGGKFVQQCMDVHLQYSDKRPERPAYLVFASTSSIILCMTRSGRLVQSFIFFCTSLVAPIGLLFSDFGLENEETLPACSWSEWSEVVGLAGGEVCAAFFPADNRFNRFRIPCIVIRAS